MSKKKNKKLTEEEMKNINPFEYTYGNEQTVEINAKLFEALIQVFSQEMQEERKVFYEEQLDKEGLPDIQKTAENQKAKVFLTDKGRYFLNFYMDLMGLHAENIQNGIAVEKEKQNEMKKVE